MARNIYPTILYIIYREFLWQTGYSLYESMKMFICLFHYISIFSSIQNLWVKTCCSAHQTFLKGYLRNKPTLQDIFSKSPYFQICNDKYKV